MGRHAVPFLDVRFRVPNLLRLSPDLRGMLDYFNVFLYVSLSSYAIDIVQYLLPILCGGHAGFACWVGSTKQLNAVLLGILRPIHAT